MSDNQPTAPPQIVLPLRVTELIGKGIPEDRCNAIVDDSNRLIASRLLLEDAESLIAIINAVTLAPTAEREAAWQAHHDSLNRDGKWTVGEYGNFYAFFIAGWNAHRAPTAEATCEWKFDGKWWNSACGNSYAFMANQDPNENGMKFCCFCGKEIK